MKNDDLQLFAAKEKHARKIKRRSGRDESDVDEYDDSSVEILPKWKFYLVIGVICLCFALLYPSVFSPMINSIFKGKSYDSKNSLNHPSMFENQQHRFRPHPSSGGVPLNPNKGQLPTAPIQQTGRGSFAWLLPIYTVGVVAFLLYTFFKNSFKSNKTKKAKKRRRDYYAASEDSYSDSSGGKLSTVQGRLKKTEKAMQSILEQLEMISKLNHMCTNPIAETVAPESVPNESMASANIKIQNQGTPDQLREIEAKITELKRLSKKLYRPAMNGNAMVDESNSESEIEDTNEIENHTTEDEIDRNSFVPAQSDSISLSHSSMDEKSGSSIGVGDESDEQDSEYGHECRRRKPQ